MRGQQGSHHRSRSGRGLPARPGQPAVQGAAAEPALGGGFHLRRHLGRLRLRGLRDRRLRPPDRRLARVTLGPERTSCSMPWSRPCTSAAPSPAAASSVTPIAGRNTSSIRYTERLAEAGIEPSVGSVGDCYDNALAETIIGLFKAEVIHRRGPWRSLRGGRVRHARMGRLVQSPAAARTDRQRASRRGRSALLCSGRGPSLGRLTQTKQPPGNPGRFTSPGLTGSVSAIAFSLKR